MQANQLKITDLKIASEQDDLRESYLQKLPKNLSLLREIWSKLSHLSWNDEAFFSLYRLVHFLADNGENIGTDQISIQMRVLERYLSPIVKLNRPPTDRERRHISSFLHIISKVAELPETVAEEIKENNHCEYSETIIERECRTIYIVDSDKHIRKILSTLLSNTGYQVRTFATPELAIDYVDKVIPDIVVMDIVYPSNIKKNVFDVIVEIRNQVGKDVALVMISARTDLAARTEAIRSGAVRYFTKPLDINLLIEKLDELGDRNPDLNNRVLIVDDDELLSHHHALLLQKTGLHTRIVNNPIDVLRCLEEYKPDLVLMDLYMPHYDGIELSAVIRQDARFTGLPIIFLSSECNADYQNKVYKLGVNEYLIKPVSEEILTNTVDRHLNLSRNIRESIRKANIKDRHSGMYNRQYFLEKLDAAVSSAMNGTEFQALIRVSIDDFEIMTDKNGEEWLEPAEQQLGIILRSCVSNKGIITHFSDATYFVLTWEQTPDKLIALTKTIRAKVQTKKIIVGNRNIKLSCNVNIIRINNHFSSSHDLLQVAKEITADTKYTDNNYVRIHERLAVEEREAKILQEKIDIAMQKLSFQLVYQPIIDADKRSYEMYEVLVRLIDNTGKTILPNQFMNKLDQKNDMMKIDRWVVENAIYSLSNDNHAHTAVDLFIKLTGNTLIDKYLIPLISNCITDCGITGKLRVIFLISEKEIVDHLDLVNEFSTQIKKIHCGIAIDHFGVTENFAHIIETINPDFIKLSSTVMEKILEDDNVYNYVKSLIEKAKISNTKIIASTIEDPATLSALWNMGVRYFQGYFIKEPDTVLDFNFKESIF